MINVQILGNILFKIFCGTISISFPQISITLKDIISKIINVFPVTTASILDPVRDVPYNEAQKYLNVLRFDIYSTVCIPIFIETIKLCIENSYKSVWVIILSCVLLYTICVLHHFTTETIKTLIMLWFFYLIFIYGMILFDFTMFYQNILICFLCIFYKLIAEIIFIQKVSFDNFFSNKTFYIKYMAIFLFIIFSVYEENNFTLYFGDLVPTTESQDPSENNFTFYLDNLMFYLNTVLFVILYLKSIYNNKFVTNIYINYGNKTDTTNKKICCEKDGKIYYETKDGTVHIVDKLLIHNITFEIHLHIPDNYEKFICKIKQTFKFIFYKKVSTPKYIIECYLTDGSCLKYDNYSYLDSSWIIFRSIDYKNEREVATIYNSDKIKAIYKIPV